MKQPARVNFPIAAPRLSRHSKATPGQRGALIDSPRLRLQMRESLNLAIGRCNRRKVMDCGGKQSATPLSDRNLSYNLELPYRRK